MSEHNTATVPPETLAAMVKHLRPDARFFTGRKFFEILLRDTGYETTMAFIAKASEIMDKGGELELADFDATNGELEAFKKSRLKYMSRRTLVGVLAEGVGGVGLLGYGGLGVGHQVTSVARGKPLRPHDSTPPEDGFQHAQNILDATAMPGVYSAIGVGMLYLASENLQKGKLSDIANAVERLAEKIEQKKQAGASGAVASGRAS